MNVVVVSGNRRSRRSLSELDTYRYRQRSYGSSDRYTGTTDLSSSRYRPSSYNVTSPRYHSQYGYSDREPRSVYPVLSETRYPDGGSMSKYTRGYDTNRNADISGKTYQSQRLYDRGKFDNPDVGAPKFEFGISYNATSRVGRGDTSTKSYHTSGRDSDTSSTSYDVTTRSDDVTTRRSPARTTSLSDRTRNQPGAAADAPYENPAARPPSVGCRPRLNSTESSGSVSSEKSEKTEDRSLLNVLKNRYKEHTERQQGNDPVTRAPISTAWRRSGHYDDVASSTTHDGNKDNKPQPVQFDKSNSLDKTHAAEGSLSKRDSHHEDRLHMKDTETSAESSRAEPSPDDLLYNFRSALRRHQLSEHDKGEEDARMTAEGVGENPAHAPAEMEAKLERLRAARAKLQEQRSSDKPRPPSFATEFRSKPEKDVKSEEVKAEVKQPEQVEAKPDTASEEEHMRGRNEPHRSSTKLSRQKLVSDDLKAKFIENRKDDNQEEVLARKRSSRKSKHKEHLEYSSTVREKEKTAEAEDTKKQEAVPTVDEMLHGTKRHADRSPSSALQKFQQADQSSSSYGLAPFGAVYTTKPPKSPSPSPVRPSVKSHETKSEKAATDVKPEPVKKAEVLPKAIDKEPDPNETDSKEKQQNIKEPEKKKSVRKLKKYNTKSKSLELGVLGKPESEVEPAKIEYKDDTKVGIDESSRLERINRYKEERKKQLAAISSKFDAAEKELPSLFLLGKAADTNTTVQRSKSLKVGTEQKYDHELSSVGRSKSLKQDRGHAPADSDLANVPKMSALKYAEIGNQLQQEKEHQEIDKDKEKIEDKHINTERIIEKLHALKRLREQHLKGETGTSIEELQHKRASKNLDDTSSIDSGVSYSSRTLLADRVMEDFSSLNVPSRDRDRSSSTERPRSSRESSRETTPKVRSFSEKSDSGLKSKFRTFSDRSSFDENTQGKSLFEFGTVYKPKEDKVGGSSIVSSRDRSRTPSERDEESGRESVDLHSRTRRKLPSIEDVLGTSEDEPFDTPKRISPEREPVKTTSILPKESVRDNIEEIKGDDIKRKKVLDNIEKARSKFKDDGQSFGVFGTKYEIGSSYMSKQDEKPKHKGKVPESMHEIEQPTEKAIPQPMHRVVDATDTSNRNISSVDVEKTRQEMLGNKEQLKEDRPPVVDSAETLSSVRKEFDPITGLYRVRQTGYRTKSRTPSREASEERFINKQEVSQAKVALAQVKEKSEERIVPQPVISDDASQYQRVKETPVNQEKETKVPVSTKVERKLATGIAAKFSNVSNESFQFGTVYTAKKDEPIPVKPTPEPEVNSPTKASVASIVLTPQASVEDEKKSSCKVEIKTSSTIKQSDIQTRRMSPVRTTKPEITPEIPVSSLVYQPPPEESSRPQSQVSTTVSTSFLSSIASPEKVVVKQEPVSPVAYEPPPVSKVFGGVKQTAQISKPVSFAYEPSAPVAKETEVKQEPGEAVSFSYASPTTIKQAEVKKDAQIGTPVSTVQEPHVPTKSLISSKQEPQIVQPFGYQPKASTEVTTTAKQQPQTAKPVSFAVEPLAAAKAKAEVKKAPAPVEVKKVPAPVEVKKEPAPVEVTKEPEPTKLVSFTHQPKSQTKQQPESFQFGTVYTAKKEDPVPVSKQADVAKPISFAYEPAKSQTTVKSQAQVSKSAAEPAEIKKRSEVKQEPKISQPVQKTVESHKEGQSIKTSHQVQKTEPPIEVKPPVTTAQPTAKTVTAKTESISSVVTKEAAVKTSDEPEKEPAVFEVQTGLQTETVVLKPVTTPEVKETQSVSSFATEEAVVKTSDESEKEPAVFEVQTGLQTETVVLKPVTTPDVKETQPQMEYLEKVLEKAKEVDPRKSEEDLTKSESEPVEHEHTVRASLTIDHKIKKRTEEEEEIAKEKLAMLTKEKEDKTVAFIKVQDAIAAKKKEMDKRHGKKLERRKSAKGKLEKSVLTKVRVESQLQDASSLDDILDRNVEYLSDMEPPDFSKGAKGDKSSGSQSRQRVKRSLKKKSLKRSKSEDRSHFQVADSDEDDVAARSRLTQDLKSTNIKLPRSRGDRSAANQRTVTSSSQHGDTPTTPGASSTVTRTAPKNAEGLEPVGNNSPVTQSVSAQQHQTGPGSRLTTDISQVKQSRSKDDVDTATITRPASVQQEAPIVSEQSSQHLTLPSVDQVGEMTSDTSDQSYRRRTYGRPSLDSSRDSETSKISDSDMSVSSALSEGSRKRRKDKSSLRKSKLNESGESDASLPPRRRESTESSRPSRSAVRRVASSRLSREHPPPDKSAQNKDEVFDVLKTHDIEISVVQRTNCGAPTSSLPDVRGTSDKLLSNSDLKHVNNTDSGTTRVAPKSSILDSKSVLPSRFALPSKVSTAITRLSEASEKSRENSPQIKKTEQATTPRGIRRGNNFSQLLQKFSSSETSSSEKSDADQSPRARKIVLKRQGAYTASSSSDDVRRTPERTQSLRLRNTASPSSDRDSTGGSIQRSSSFKSDFMKRRFSPDPENRRRLPETPVEQSDKPSPELANVLNKRSTIVAKQQEEGEVIERRRIHDGRVEKAEQFKEVKPDEVIADSEVLQMLRSRRKETDESVSESEHKSQSESATTQASVPQQQATVMSHKQTENVTETPKRGEVQKAQEVQKPKEEAKLEKQKRLPSESSFESKTMITLSSPPVNKVVDPPLTVPQVKEVPKPATAEPTTVVPPLDLSAIDTSLSVLNQVSASVDETKTPSEQDTKLQKALTNVNVSSEAEVVQFIKDVESRDKMQERKEEKLAPAKTDLVQTTVQSSLPSSKLREEEEFRRAGSPSSTGTGTIDITSRSEIKKKFSAREKTPERQSPLRSVPMKVTSPMKATVGLSRTESMGRTDSERPKGILKRTPSLKATTGMHVDPELAEVLKSRRPRDEEEEEEEKQRLTVEEEIRQQRELQAAKDAGVEGDVEREVSVAERVFQMHNKIEEIRSCPITPRRSGFTTPKAILQLSGPGTPGNQYSFDEDNSKAQPEPISGSQLIERLTSLEGQRSAVSEKRRKFQQVRRAEDWRTRTQPVTLLEIKQADGLETVRKFRTEVIQKATVGLFEELEKEGIKESEQKTEFPQSVKHEHITRSERHKTTPITAAELNAIPEGQISGTTNTLKKKFENLGARDSKADSGILSGSDGDNLSHISDSVKSLSMEENIEDHDPVKMSVSAKASMFLQIQESLKERQDKRGSASGAKRYIDRKKRERSRTLPITEDEVKLAAEIADKEEEQAKKEAEEKEKEVEKGTIEAPEKTAEQAAEEADELSRQSLKDKVKLFASIEEEKKTAALKKGPVPPPPKRRNRKLASRFSTQPVTFEEVEKAAKISPLACSLVKPPDPEILSGLSVKAQRELIAQHAEKALSQPGSRSGSRPTSRSTSITDLTGGFLNEDALTATNTEVNENIGDWAPSDRVRPSDLKGKTFTSIKVEETKTQTVEKFSSELDSNRKSILKSELEQKLLLGLQHDTKGILKPLGGAVPTVGDIKSILKKDSSVESTTSSSSEVKGILKKEGSFDRRKTDSDKNKSAMKMGDRGEGDGKDVAKTSDDVESDSKDLESDTKDNVEGVESSGDNLDSDDAVLDDAVALEEDKTNNSKTRPKKSSDRRRFNRDRKLEAERYKTQPAETTSNVDETSRPKKKYVGRHLTQPVTPDEKKEAEVATATPEIAKTGSIHDRLNALKKSGEETWKKRVSRPDDLDRVSLSPPGTPPTGGVKMRDKRGLADTPRPSSIADRLSLLDNAQAGWRERIGETDVKKFTIEHKISASGQPVGESPLVARLKGSRLKKDLSRESESSDTSELPSPSSPTKECSKFSLPREVVCTEIPPELLKEESKSPLATIKSEEEEKGPVNVEVPDVGAEMEHFFVKKEVLEKVSQEIEVSVDDFDELFLNANDMLETKQRIKPKRRHKQSSRNPMKTMSACLDVRTEYTEQLTGVAERELKRQKVGQISQNSGFAVEALAGLASKENFAKVALRKTDSTGTSRLEPYLPTMLIHIKGRRKVQCRLVEPSAASLNSGDCFVLITGDKNIMWCGEYCNVIEKAKAADFCDQVKQKRDLGCKGARDVTILEEKKARLSSGRHFWEILGGVKDYLACGPPEEDELYENHIIETNMIYQMEDNKLVPVEECWGGMPKYGMLTSDKVFVFDFGSEVYLWQGKSVSPNQRKISLKLAEQVWNKGYNYSQCDINPLSPLKTEEEGGLPNEDDKRPDWALFGKVNENMETILFREKFSDWPDTSRLIKVKSQDEATPAKIDLADLKAYDAKLMVPVNTNPVTMVLDGSNVGRGLQWEQDMDGFIQTQLIETLKVRVWHVLEYDHYEVEEQSFGQFHEGDTYVIRWQFMIVNAGMKSLKGNASRHGSKGRERCAYFFWQGKSSTINEKGASALMTVELDEERGPQVRVAEGKEPPCFLNLFKGRMIIHIGKREEEDTNTVGPWKFYCLRNEYENEICLIEVPRDIGNLRSVSSFLLLNVKTGRLLVWHGCKSPEHTRKLATKAASNLKERCPLEVGLHKGKEIDISEVNEGEEELDFWRIVSVTRGDRSGYNSLLNNTESFHHTLRLFHMTSVSGVFEAVEVINPSRSPDLPTRFPALQTDLYKASQPALFLIDNGHEVFLWQGWLPEADENAENVLTGSAVTRLSTERKCAMETTIHYCKEINPDNPPPAYLVYAGLEPMCFTNLFPLWTVYENVKEINLRDGKADGEMVLVEELLKKVNKTRYTLAELLEIPPPEGVDPLKLESYLSDEEFEAVLDMTREEFYALPNWKQSKVKQQCGLY